MHRSDVFSSDMRCLCNYTKKITVIFVKTGCSLLYFSINGATKATETALTQEDNLNNGFPNYHNAYFKNTTERTTKKFRLF